MDVIRQTSHINKASNLNVIFNFDKEYGIKSFKAEEVLQTIRDIRDVSLISDMRTHLYGLIITPTYEVHDIIRNYTSLLAAFVNKNFSFLSPVHESLCTMGFVLAFAAPDCFANRINAYEKILLESGVKSRRVSAYSPYSIYSYHSTDLWVSKMDVCELLSLSHPSEVRSSHVADYLHSKRSV